MKQLQIKTGVYIISVLMFTSICFASSGGFESGPWKILSDAENILVFDPEYVPSSLYPYALAVPGQAEEIIVTISDPAKQSGNHGWQSKRVFDYPIPFMGRKKVVEEEIYHGGIAYIEVFDRKQSTKALVQFQRNYEKLDILPQIRHLACWIMS